VVEWRFLQYSTKLPPLFERGYRAFEVPSFKAHRALLEILAIGDLEPSMRFKIGPTDQIPMGDGFTVVNIMSELFRPPAILSPW